MYHFIIFLLTITLVKGLYTSSDDVIGLTSNNFNNKIKNSDSIWIVEFYAPWCGHCQQLAPEYKKAATILKGIVNVAAIDCDKDQSLAQQYNVKGFPTIKVFVPGKSTPVSYEGARTSGAIIEFALKQVKSVVEGRGGKTSDYSDSGSSKSDVIELTDNNFDAKVLKSDDIWLVEFFAPWCGHCKNLEPEFKSAARTLKGKVKLGAVDATVHTNVASKYKVQGYPTLLIFGADKTNPEPYEHGRVASDIVNIMSEKAMANISPPKAEELINQSLLDKCKEKQLCVIAALPDLLDCQSKCRRNYISMMEKVGEKYKMKDWTWLWTAATAQPALEKQLNMGGFGYPAMVAYNVKKSKFAPLRGSFSLDGIQEFLRDVSLGSRSIALFDVNDIPIVKSISAWDGKDGKPPVEDEIDLSELKDEL